MKNSVDICPRYFITYYLLLITYYLLLITLLTSRPHTQTDTRGFPHTAAIVYN